MAITWNPPLEGVTKGCNKVCFLPQGVAPEMGLSTPESGGICVFRHVHPQGDEAEPQVGALAGRRTTHRGLDVAGVSLIYSGKFRTLEYVHAHALQL